jgi:hypothetical protein
VAGSKGIAQELTRAPHLLPYHRGTPLKEVGRYVHPRVDWRGHGRMLEQSYDPIVPRKAENRRAPERGGHGIRWREGGNKRTYLSKET